MNCCGIQFEDAREFSEHLVEQHNHVVHEYNFTRNYEINESETVTDSIVIQFPPPDEEDRCRTEDSESDEPKEDATDDMEYVESSSDEDEEWSNSDQSNADDGDDEEEWVTRRDF